MRAITADELRAAGLRRCGELRLNDHLMELPDLDLALGYSDFIYRVFLAASPEIRSALLEWAKSPPTRSRLLDILRRSTNLAITAERGLATIALRELCGFSSTRETLYSTTLLAECVLRSAIGTVHSDLVVFGLGKMGGYELNFYSDLDLVFGCKGQGNERAVLSAAATARKMVERVQGTYRVDLRLRPFGSSGPLVMPLPVMEAYFQQHGREWERYAWIKARCVAGDIIAGRSFLSQIRPFIFRKYLDYNVLQTLRDLKAQISQEATRQLGDIKRGPGGIREVEFLVQAFQLVRGGRANELSGSRLRSALKGIKAQKLLGPVEVESLYEAYLYLRRVENRLQLQKLAPIHYLPTDPLARIRLAQSLGYWGWDDFLVDLTAHRDAVSAMFEAVLKQPKTTSKPKLERLWMDHLPKEDACTVLVEYGFSEPETLIELLDRLRGSRSIRLMSERGRETLDQLLPLLIAESANYDDPDKVLYRMLEFVYSLLRRSAYLALLVERPAARARLVNLAGRSPWIAKQLSAVPAALDELLDSRTKHPMNGQELSRYFRIAATDDPASGETAAALRERVEIQRLKIASAFADGSYKEREVEQGLSRLAESSIRLALKMAAKRLGIERWTGDGRCGIVVIAYGKLGSRELCFDSDLDLVFLFDRLPTGAQLSKEPEVLLARLAQRTLSLLTQPTAEGPLYRVDTRLRPEGSAGLLLSRFDAWCRYQRDQAWLWERQALLRARTVAGSPRLARRFSRARLRLLSRPVAEPDLQSEILSMHDRVLSSGPRRDAKSRALLEGEFLAARWTLGGGPAVRRIARSPGITGQLASLEALGLTCKGNRLAHHLEVLREVRNRSILGLPAKESSTREAIDHIACLWKTQFGPHSPI